MGLGLRATGWERRSLGDSRAPGTLPWRVKATEALLGGSWVVINGAISRVTIHLITPLITTHEPPSREFRAWRLAVASQLE